MGGSVGCGWRVLYHLEAEDGVDEPLRLRVELLHGHRQLLPLPLQLLQLLHLVDLAPVVPRRYVGTPVAGTVVPPLGKLPCSSGPARYARDRCAYLMRTARLWHSMAACQHSLAHDAELLSLVGSDDLLRARLHEELAELDVERRVRRTSHHADHPTEPAAAYGALLLPGSRRRRRSVARNPGTRVIYKRARASGTAEQRAPR